MKTLKVLFAVLMLGLFTLATYAQPPKTVECETLTWETVYYPCIEEGLSGPVEICTITWNNKMQVKLTGSLVGETSGTTYTVNGIGNWMIRPMMNGNAENQTQVVTMSICLDGVQLLKLHMTMHYTINANGDLVVEVDNYYYECL